MGRIAAEMAYLRLDGDDRAPQQRTIDCTVVARGSGELPAP
jgi:DNA-binding LacI/PurR family transcriptional regulator